MRFFLLHILIGYTGLSLTAQDATFTLIDHNPLSTNPAYALPGNGQFQFLSLSRQQWWNLPGPSASSASYNMNQASFLAPIISRPDNGLGLGFQLNRNSSGEGRLGMNNAQLFTASRIGWKVKRQRLDFGAGVGIGIQQYTLDWNQLTFTSQLDPFYGLVNTFPNVNPRVGSSNLAITGSFGMKGAWTSKINQKIISVKSGAAVYHLNKPGISFFDYTERIKPRYSVHNSVVYFPENKLGLVGNVTTTYYVLRHNYQYQYPLSTHETRIGTNLNGVLTLYSGFRRRLFHIGRETVDAIMWSIQINAPGMVVSVGYDFTVSELNVQRTRGTTEIGIIIPLGSRGNIRAKRASEPCFVDYLLTHSEWKAVEKFNNKSTNWGREYSPVTFIL
ncbi:type IX secretion system membrane protein PorP/SprF [Schleiferiaceae bacterium]|nr:type IX secretion system membrane protein PorP/SprF [Schleiferiaceae bacterium]